MCFVLSPQEVVKVDAVLGLVTPIGAQMEHDRGRVSAFWRTGCVNGVSFTAQAFLKETRQLTSHNVYLNLAGDKRRNSILRTTAVHY